jgi:hypothetical protein
MLLEFQAHHPKKNVKKWDDGFPDQNYAEGFWQCNLLKIKRNIINIEIQINDIAVKIEKRKTTEKIIES